ncbi:MAG TPA: hypothetical protein VIY47_11505 [Ignavibacteriaceae bacterium]
MNKYFIISLSLLVILFISCNVQPEKSELKYYPISDLNGVIAQTGIQIDKDISDDGNGSIRIDAVGPLVIQLYFIDDVSVEETQVVYEANVKSERLNGQAYLEMWRVFKDKGEFFSRGFDSVISETSDWKTIRTVFNLKKGETPDQIKLNVVVNGTGTIWIDAVHLSKI